MSPVRWDRVVGNRGSGRLRQQPSQSSEGRSARPRSPSGLRGPGRDMAKPWRNGPHPPHLATYPRALPSPDRARERTTLPRHPGSLPARRTGAKGRTCRLKTLSSGRGDRSPGRRPPAPPPLAFRGGIPTTIPRFVGLPLVHPRQPQRRPKRAAVRWPWTTYAHPPGSGRDGLAGQETAADDQGPSGAGTPSALQTQHRGPRPTLHPRPRDSSLSLQPPGDRSPVVGASRPWAKSSPKGAAGHAGDLPSTRSAEAKGLCPRSPS